MSPKTREFLEDYTKQKNAEKRLAETKARVFQKIIPKGIYAQLKGIDSVSEKKEVNAVIEEDPVSILAKKFYEEILTETENRPYDVNAPSASTSGYTLNPYPPRKMKIEEPEVKFLIYQFMDKRNSQSLEQLLVYIHYPAPWPEHYEVSSIEYSDGKLSLILDEDKPEDHKSEPDGLFRHRIQQPGYKKSRPFTVSSDIRKWGTALDKSEWFYKKTADILNESASSVQESHNAQLKG